jgi:hypothetical protein
MTSHRTPSASAKSHHRCQLRSRGIQRSNPAAWYQELSLFNPQEKHYAPEPTGPYRAPTTPQPRPNRAPTVRERYPHLPLPASTPTAADFVACALRARVLSRSERRQRLRPTPSRSRLDSLGDGLRIQKLFSIFSGTLPVPPASCFPTEPVWEPHPRCVLLIDCNNNPRRIWATGESQPAAVLLRALLRLVPDRQIVYGSAAAFRLQCTGT